MPLFQAMSHIVDNLNFELITELDKKKFKLNENWGKKVYSQDLNEHFKEKDILKIKAQIANNILKNYQDYKKEDGTIYSYLDSWNFKTQDNDRDFNRVDFSVLKVSGGERIIHYIITKSKIKNELDYQGDIVEARTLDYVCLVTLDAKTLKNALEKFKDYLDRDFDDEFLAKYNKQ